MRVSLAGFFAGAVERKSTAPFSILDCDIFTELSFSDGIWHVVQIDTTDKAKLPYTIQKFDSLVTARKYFNSQPRTILCPDEENQLPMNRVTELLLCYS
jgi:hypothetical protein